MFRTHCSVFVVNVGFGLDEGQCTCCTLIVCVMVQTIQEIIETAHQDGSVTNTAQLVLR